MRTMTAALAALAALPPAAVRADEFPFTTWTEQDPGTYTRTVRLDEGRDYALAAAVAHGYGITLGLSIAGRDVADLAIDSSGDAWDGTTFRAPATGAYTLTMTIPGEQEFGCPCGAEYHIAQDCRADTRTLCKLPVGKSEPARLWNYSKDDDWFRTTLRGRQRYEAWLHDPQDCVIAFRVLDTKGREVPSSTISHPSGDTSIRFTPPTSGTYFVAAEGVCESGGPDAGGPYGISLTAR